MTDPAFRAFDDEPAWAKACAEALAAGMRAALAEHGRAVLAASGGTTPWPVYRLLSRADLDWTRVEVTLVDERRVPETDPASNAAAVKANLLTGPAADARFGPLDEGPVGRVDVALLGMGDDGHFASIFPDSPSREALLDRHRPPACLAVPAGDGVAPPQARLSLNLSALLQASTLVLAVRGEAKRALIEQVRAGRRHDLPVAALFTASPPPTIFWSP